MLEEHREINAIFKQQDKKRHLSQIPIPSNELLGKKLSEGYITKPIIHNRRTFSEQINRHDRYFEKTIIFMKTFSFSSAMQLTTNPALATAASPALHKDHWQQRRYDFLSRNSMFSGELRDDVNESEQR